MLKSSRIQFIAAMGLLMASLMSQAADKNGEKSDNAGIKLQLERIVGRL